MAVNPKDQIRELALNDLEAFIALVHPGRVLGNIHREVIRWWTRQDQKSHQLLLLPRDHQKSALIAYRVAWEITRNPALRVLYISSTSNLATKQLKFIKDILTSSIYRFYWPEMVSEDEGTREKWTEGEISVDHPARRLEAVRDPTIFTAGLTTSITGLHCDIAILDDVVVKENAYTDDGRQRVREQYSLLASVEGTDAREWIVGTRYHPNDLYNDLININLNVFNESNEITGEATLYEVMERAVEDSLDGNGTGQYIWPRQQRADGKMFGFDATILERKRNQYLDRTQFRAQYYNNPNLVGDSVIDRSLFQYYDPKNLIRLNGKWHLKGRRLNVFAAVDFAFSLGRRADYSSIVVVGIDASLNYYILDIDRFKTDRISDYFNHILSLHQKWDFRKIRAETTSAQKVIVEDLKSNYIRPHGLSLVVDGFSPSRAEGSKEERVEAILQPRYANNQMFHYTSGNCQILEEELIQQHPPHDDVKDCLAACISICLPPSNSQQSNTSGYNNLAHSRFGGIY